MTLYEKRGRRYFPAAENVALDSLTEGAHLVVVRPGQRSVYCRIDPEYPALLAAAKVAEDAMVDAMMKAHRTRYAGPKPLTRKQADLVEQLHAAGAFPMFEHASPQEIIEAGVKALIAAAAKETH